jgi:hypothetical protein
MEFNKNTNGYSAAQLANGTPSDRVLILKSFFKDDKCTISPTKDINKVLGTQYEHPEIKKLEMGYVPSVESRLKLYDGIEIDLNTTWGWDWGGCSTVLRSQKIFNQGKGLQELISTFSDQGLNLLRRLETEQRVELMNTFF